MPTSHILVLNSLIYAGILFALLAIYRYVFPKKHIPPLVLLILISCLPLLSVLRPGTYESGDLSLHTREAMTFYSLLKEGEIFPLWSGESNATYGYPAFLFTYPLPFYVMAFFHFLGFSFLDSTKLLLATAYVMSGFFMFLFLKKEFGEKAALVGGLVYLFAPYHLVNLHFRVDIGEITAFVFLPLVLLLSRNYIETKSYKWFLIQVLSVACLVLSHPAISIAGLPVLFIYILLLIIKSNKKHRLALLIQQITAFIMGVLLSAFYWLPVMYEIQFTQQALYSTYLAFLQVHELLYSPWRFGLLFQGPEGQLSFLLGYAQLIIILIAFVLLIKKSFIKHERTLILISLALVFFLAFMMIEIAKPLWYILPLIKNFQFTYRLLGIEIFIIAIIAAVVAKYITSKLLLVLLCGFIVFSTILNWGNRRNIPAITDNELRQGIPMAALHGGGINQAITLWSDPKTPYAKIIPRQNSEVINGRGTIKETYRSNILHRYAINAQTDVLVRENTLYFPGWNVYINNEKVNIEILKYSSPRGLISFDVPKGKHTVEVIFQDTPVRTLGKSISLVSLLSLFTLLLLNKFFKISIKKR